MSKSGKWSCPHCGRDNFRSARGLDQHLQNNKVCSVLEKHPHLNAYNSHSGNANSSPSVAARNNSTKRSHETTLEDNEVASQKISTSGQKRAKVQGVLEVEQPDNDDNEAACFGDESFGFEEGMDLFDDDDVPTSDNGGGSSHGQTDETEPCNESIDSHLCRSKHWKPKQVHVFSS